MFGMSSCQAVDECGVVCTFSPLERLNVLTNLMSPKLLIKILLNINKIKAFGNGLIRDHRTCAQHSTVDVWSSRS